MRCYHTSMHYHNKECNRCGLLCSRMREICVMTLWQAPVPQNEKRAGVRRPKMFAGKQVRVNLF